MTDGGQPVKTERAEGGAATEEDKMAKRRDKFGSQVVSRSPSGAERKKKSRSRSRSRRKRSYSKSRSRSRGKRRNRTPPRRPRPRPRGNPRDPESNRVWVGGLPDGITKGEIQDAFEK